MLLKALRERLIFPKIFTSLPTMTYNDSTCAATCTRINDVREILGEDFNCLCKVFTFNVV